jgi:hypothetical protein
MAHSAEGMAQGAEDGQGSRKKDQGKGQDKVSGVSEKITDDRSQSSEDRSICFGLDGEK